jgi:hypothetical protein
MVVETWIEMLREKLKYISSLLRLDTSVIAFLRARTSGAHPLEVLVIVHVSQNTYQAIRPGQGTATHRQR